MKTGTTRFSQGAATLFLTLALLLGTAEPAFAFGKKPETPPSPPPAAPKPSLKVDTPAAAYTVGKSVTVTGKATAISKISLVLDNAVLASSALPSFSLTAVFTAAQIGKHTLSVVGYDAKAKVLARLDYKVEVKAAAHTLNVDNLKNGQSFTDGDNALFYIVASEGIDAVEVSRNGTLLGAAEYVAEQKKFRFNTILAGNGAFDLKFVGKIAGGEVVAKTYNVNVFPKAPPPPAAKNFNGYILKAVDKIRAEYGLLGYNIKAVYTHDLDYGGLGTLKSTYGSLTMCVAAALEVILTAYDIYAEETGDRSVYEYLPFKSWNSLAATGIKSRIWVDPKLDAYGTADALNQFGMGELVPFSELQPGSFVNINRENGTGHAVVFISYIDIKANELPKYDAAKVAGFKYFSAQGKEARGQGGFDYRYAFFAKSGCPTISYHRDCGLIYSTSRKYLNTGTMWHPRDWRKPASVSSDGMKMMTGSSVAPLSKEDLELMNRPAKFDGMTTDD